jgi:hypothetical protein
MLWFIIWQGPIGIDLESFTGPALNMLYIFCYIFPVLFAGLYFRAKETNAKKEKIAVSIFILVLTLCTAVGTFAATMGMWLPRL